MENAVVISKKRKYNGAVIVSDIEENAAMKREDLLINGLSVPYGVSGQPVFGWKAEAFGYGSGQTAYRVLVCSDALKAQAQEGDLWDSGKVESDVPGDVVYQGKTLASKTEYFWCVQTWNEKGQVSGFSEIASFTTGILQQEEWQGCWIGAGNLMPRETVEQSPMSCEDETVFSRRAPLLRKVFTADCKKRGGVKSARLFVSGLGLFELQINGQRPDDSVLHPGNTQYTQTVPYCAYDVTSLICDGENVLGAELGNGFYNEHTGVWQWQTAKWRDNPKLLLNLDIHYGDGSWESIATDTDWKVYTKGPTVANSIYLGETYDANLEPAGWLEAAFDDSGWFDAQQMAAPAGKLSCQTMPPVRRVVEAHPASVEKVGDSSWIVESPETMSGWAKIRMKAARGKKITITYAEQRTPEGAVITTGNNEGCCGGWWPEGIIQQDFYISDGIERFWEPKFTYKGYRYIQIDGYEEELTCKDVICYCLANEMEQISAFTCSDASVVQLHQMMNRTMRNNFIWKPTDTPVWEKNGWLGDANVALSSMFFQFDIRHMMRQFVEIMQDCFREYHTIPPIVPSADWSIPNQPVWNSLFVFAAEKMYDYWGELETVRRLYPELKAYAETIIGEIRELGWSWKDEQLSDWVSPMQDTNVENGGDSSEGASLCGSAFIYMMLSSMERLSGLVGKEEDKSLWQQAKAQIYDTYQKKFYRPEEKLYDTGYWKQIGNRSKYRQNSALLSLAAGLVPKEVQADVAERLVQDVREKDFHLDTGCVGTRYVLPVLTDWGYPDVAWKVLKQDTYPSWGYMLKFGSDCLWENYEFAGRSRDHYFLGTCDEYFYTHLAGIRSVKNGCKDIVIAPVFYPRLTYAGTSMKTMRGELKSYWECKEDGSICLQVKVPYGAKAQIILPANSFVQNGMEGICEMQKTDCGKEYFGAVSGEYTFVVGKEDFA